MMNKITKTKYFTIALALFVGLSFGAAAMAHPAVHPGVHSVPQRDGETDDAATEPTGAAAEPSGTGYTGQNLR